MVDDLSEIKRKIKLESADPEVNKTLMGYIDNPSDCFGRRFLSTDVECIDCTVLADIDGRKELLWVFCKEICEHSEANPPSPTEEPSEELKAAIQEVAEKKEKPKVAHPDAEWKAKLASMLAGQKEDSEIIKTIIEEFQVEERKVKMVLAGYKSAAKRGYKVTK